MKSFSVDENATATRHAVIKPLQTQTKPHVFTDRTRTNILRGPEQKLLAVLCKAMPSWVTPDLLTFIGMVGSGIVLTSFILAKQNKYFMLLSILGFAVNWFGDSLDGRIAYFRNKPRKWYGFALDMNMDWISSIMMGYGFYYYLPEPFKVFSFALVAFYGWTMIMAQMKYKLADVYVIDSAYLGPTEFRIILCIVLTGSIFLPGMIGYATIFISAVILAICIKDLIALLKLGNERDRLEAEKKKE